MRSGSMDRSDIRSQSLDLLRFPLAVVVLSMHVFTTQPFSVKGVDYSFDSMPIFLAIIHFIDGFLRDQSVPIYYFISGFVFFLCTDFTKDIYLRKLHNRSKTLLIPYMIWNTVAILALLIIYTHFFNPELLQAKGYDFSPQAILSCYWDRANGIFTDPSVNRFFGIFPENSPLWFVRELMIVVISTPVIHWLIKRAGVAFLSVLCMAWFFAYYYSDNGYVDQISTAFFFFSFGAMLSIRGIDMIRFFGRFRTISIISYLAFSTLYIISVSNFPMLSSAIKRLNVMAGLFFAYNMSSWLLQHHICHVNRFLASSSYFIYLSHIIIYMQVLKLHFYIFSPTSEIATILMFLSTVAVEVLLLLAIYYMLGKFTPKLLKILTGSR